MVSASPLAGPFPQTALLPNTFISFFTLLAVLFVHSFSVPSNWGAIEVMASQQPDDDQVAKILAAQQQAARNAGKRRGERPRDLPSRNQIVGEFTMVSLSNQRGLI